MRLAALIVTLLCSSLYLTAALTQKPIGDPRISTSPAPTPTPEPCYCASPTSTGTAAGDAPACKDGLRVAYKQSEVDKRAVMKARVPEPEYTGQARAHNTTGVVRLSVVLCPSGRVSSIAVVEGLPDGLTESAIATVKGIKFAPAEKGGQKVAQFQLFEFYFGD